LEEKNSSSNVWNEKLYTSIIFQSTRTLPHTPTWGYWEVSTCTPKVNVDGWEALESFKDLVRQRAHPEGSMVEVYMVYQTVVYITQYSPQIATSINLDRI